MKKLFALAICYIFITLPCLSFAEIRTISWDSVTTYTDGSQIESAKIVSYVSYWSLDSALPLSSLHQIGTIGTATFATFDPTVQGMIRGTTVFFTAKAILNTGEESALSPAFPWLVPAIVIPGTPGMPTLNSVLLSK